MADITDPAAEEYARRHSSPEPALLTQAVRNTREFSGSYLLRPGTPRRDRFVDWAKRVGLLATSYTEAEFDDLVAQAGMKYGRKERNGQMILFTLVKA